MKKNLIYLIITLLGLTTLYSCAKTNGLDIIKKTCLYNTKTNYFKKWANTFTEIDSVSASGAVLKRGYIYPLGYFKLNINLTYNVLSDNVPLTGNWTITDSCQLELDAHTPLDRKFDVVKLTTDSLTLSRNAGSVTYIQHYAAYNCPSDAQLEQQWDNISIVEQAYSSTALYPPYTIYPVGYFKLNSDSTYNVLSDGAPLNGTWTLDANCKLILDNNTALQRSFDIQKITADTLIIWRKDTVAKVNYQQIYKKH